MANKTLHKSGKRKPNKKQSLYLRLLLLTFLFITIIFTVLQVRQSQTYLQHAQSATCGSPGDKGNEMGVGKYCTQGGGQCLGTGAPICSADIQLNGQGICSKACNTDADCGTGAMCYQDTLGKGCKPDVCSNTPTATPKPTVAPKPTAVPTVKLSPTVKPTIPAPTKPIPPTAAPKSTLLTFSVFLHGIGSSGDNKNQSSSLSNKNPVHPQRTFTITFTNGQNIPVTTQQASFTYTTTTGFYTWTADLGNAFATGFYDVTIKTTSFVPKTVQGIEIIQNQKNTLAAVSLIAGDVNNDGTLNMLDYNAIIGCFSELSQPKSCTDAQKQSADLNDDSKVDQTDYNLFLRELSVSKP